MNNAFENVPKNEQEKKVDRDAIREEKRIDKFNYKEFPQEKLESLSKKTGFSVKHIQAATSLILSQESPILDIDSLDEVEEILRKLSNHKPDSNEEYSSEELLERLIESSNDYHKLLLFAIRRRVEIENDSMLDCSLSKSGEWYGNVKHKGVLHLSPRIYNMLAYIDKTKIDMPKKVDVVDVNLEESLKKIGSYKWYEIGYIKEELATGGAIGEKENPSLLAETYKEMMDLSLEFLRIQRKQQ